MTDVWYYALNEKPVGPLSKTQLIEALSRTSRAENALVWRSDFLDWRKLSELSELRLLLTFERQIIGQSPGSVSSEFSYIAKPPPLPRTPPPLPTYLTASRTMPGALVDEVPNRMNIITALFGFRGRLNRTQYALLFLIGYIGPIALVLVIESQTHDTASIILTLLPFPMLWVVLALLAKRFHDIDKPGSWSLLIFIPIVNLFTLITMFFIPGTPEANQYGPPT
jgi:uncharacterized membrane protein YhaH (DUF805 family)